MPCRPHSSTFCVEVPAGMCGPLASSGESRKSGEGQNWGSPARANPDICGFRFQTSAKIRLTATLQRLVQSKKRIAPATAVLADGASAPRSLPSARSGMILRANGAKIERTASGQQGPIGLLHAAIQQGYLLREFPMEGSQAILTISERPKPNRQVLGGSLRNSSSAARKEKS